MQKNLKNSHTDHLLMARMRGRQVVQQNLGALRDFAVQVKWQDPNLDEEEFFKELGKNWIKGVNSELYKVLNEEELWR